MAGEPQSKPSQPEMGAAWTLNLDRPVLVVNAKSLVALLGRSAYLSEVQRDHKAAAADAAARRRPSSPLSWASDFRVWDHVTSTSWLGGWVPFRRVGAVGDRASIGSAQVRHALSPSTELDVVDGGSRKTLHFAKGC